MRTYKIESNNIIIDWGCGLGKLLNDIYIIYKYNCIGFNISEKQINLARQLYKNINFTVTSGDTTNLKENSINIVVSQEAITHSPNKNKLFSEFHKILKINGLLIFQDWFEIDNNLSIIANQLYKSNVEPLKNYIKILNNIGFRNIQIHKPIDSKDYGSSDIGCESFIISCIK